jgi:hypothetical protein
MSVDRRDFRRFVAPAMRVHRDPVVHTDALQPSLIG